MRIPLEGQEPLAVALFSSAAGTLGLIGGHRVEVSQGGDVPSNLKPIIYGQNKKVDFAKFNAGNLLKAIAFDLAEFGQKGVQGVKVLDGFKRFISYEEKANRAKAPYLQAGMIKGSLYLVLRDAENAKFEAMELLVKDYAKLKEKLARNSASVSDIAPDDDRIIKNSVRDTGQKLGVKPQDNPDFGAITGNIVLTAHGTPARVPSGRIIGSKLGRRTPKQIFELLTTSSDPKKRVGKDYSGTLTLCGCFTASGGPEGEKQDDPFAKKVLDLFRKSGYAKISVVGYPGATITESAASGGDSKGTRTRRGDEKVLANQPTAKEMQRAQQLEKAVERALKARNDLVDPYNRALAVRDQAAQDLRDGLAASGLRRADYLKTDEGKARARTYSTASKAFESAEKKFEKADESLQQIKKMLKDSGLNDTYARLEGRFGLRQVN